MLVVLWGNEPLPLRAPLGEIDWWLRGALTRLVVSGKFFGRERESLLFLDSATGVTILLFGVGRNVPFSEAAAEHLVHLLGDLRVSRAMIAADSCHGAQLIEIKKHMKQISCDLYAGSSV